jgi:MFS family permease
MIIAGAGLFIMTQMPLDANPWFMRLDMAVLGIGIGILMPVAQTAVSTTAEERYRGVASSTVTFFRSIGGVFGSAVMAVLVNRHMTSAIDTEAPKLGVPMDKLQDFTNPQVLLRAGGEIPEKVINMLKNALGDGIHLGFWFLVCITVLGLAAAWFTGSARYDATAQKTNQAAGNAH